MPSVGGNPAALLPADTGQELTAPTLEENVKKSFLERAGNSFIPRKSKDARAGREGRDLAQGLLPGSEGKAQTVPGSVPREAPQLPAERRFWICFEAAS